MKIAFILPSLANRGPIIIARHLVINLIKNHEVDVYHFDDVKEINFPCPTHSISFSRSIDFKNYDFIHSHMFRPDLYIAWHKSKIPKGTKLISTIHQESYKALQMEYNALFAYIGLTFWNYSLRRFDRIVALNKTIASQLSIHEEKIRIIGNGISISTDSDVPADEGKRIESFRKKYNVIIGTSSLLINRKGLDQIIKILTEFPDVGYIIVGDGPEKKALYDLALCLGVEKQCLFLGQKPRGYRYFKFFNIYMLPSRSEGFPICAIEAAQWKLPIVSSDIKVLKEIFRPDEVVFFELDNHKSLKDALHKARETSALLSNRIFVKFQKELSDKKMTEKYECLYREILIGRRA